ncbi:MAG: adenylyl-sulfate kinase [Haliangiales bacterium]
MNLVKNGCLLWFTGLSGAGKSTLSERVAACLVACGCPVELLDGDEVRTHLSKGLGFSKEDRDTNVRRIGFVARLLARHGVLAITAAISPYRAIRDEQRALCAGQAAFCEVYMECPIEVLAERDVKGLYKKALAGEIEHFTGVSDPYEPPERPEVLVRSDRDAIDDGALRVIAQLVAQGVLDEAITAQAQAFFAKETA